MHLLQLVYKGESLPCLLPDFGLTESATSLISPEVYTPNTNLKVH